MVGDTLHTDILGGRQMGFSTSLVTGHGALVGLDVGAVVGCSVGAGVGHATFGHDSDCVTSVHSLSGDVRVRCLTPLLPHDAEHAPKGPKAL